MARNFRHKGGHARAASLTPERRSEIARNAAKARHRKADIGKPQEERQNEMNETDKAKADALIKESHELALKIEQVLVDTPNYRVGLCALAENCAAGIVGANNKEPIGVALDIQAFIAMFESHINAQMRRVGDPTPKPHEDAVQTASGA